jgi:hypothetical protein
MSARHWFQRWDHCVHCTCRDNFIAIVIYLHVSVENIFVESSAGTRTGRTVISGSQCEVIFLLLGIIDV